MCFEKASQGKAERPRYGHPILIRRIIKMRQIKFRAWHINDKEMLGHKDACLIPLFTPSFRYRDGETVLMQFTGLTDKNGVEIYEGDILGSEKSDSDAWYVSHHQVVWHDSGLMGKQICSNGSYIGIDYHTNRTSHPYVVIGNIHQNPELLEGGK